jgi:hypothetical protein
MRSSEFLNEAGRDGTPMTDAEFAAQQAQGAKNLDSIKGFGRKIAGALGGGAQSATPYPDAATARASLTPSQLKWLGGADPMDKYIMARLPAPLPGETVAAAPAAAPAAPASNVAQNAATASQLGDKTPAAPAAPAATPVADAVAASGEPDNVTGVDAAVAANAANTATTVQATTPPAKAPARSTISPAILGYASSMGLYKNGQPDIEAIKAFQRKNGLKVDGAIGPNTSGAILSAAKPGDAGSGRGGAGGPTATQVAQAATPAAAPPRPSFGMASQFEWDRQYAKTHNANGTAKGAQAATPAPVDVAKIDAEIKRFSSGNNMSLQANKDYVAGLEKKKTGGQAATPAPLTPRQGGPMRESNFEESVSRMRRLSTLLKG